MHVLAKVILLLLPASGLAADLRWQPAPRSDDFVESIGVCTHWCYRNTPYGKSYEAAKQRLAESGIRHVRDGWDVRQAELWKDLGVRTTLLSDPSMGTLEKQAVLWQQNLGSLAMLEGPNEPNNFWPRFNVRYKAESYPKAVKLWQDDLYKLVRGEARFASLAVASPTPIFNGAYELTPLVSFDLLATHPYAGGNMPSESVTWAGRNMRATFALLGPGQDLKPLLASESGYHYATGTKVLGGQQSGISEAAGGKYFPRHFAEYWRAGFVRTFTYEFLDERPDPVDPEANFGLVRNDLSPKPAFTALSNMIAILGESRWDAQATRWVREEAPARAVALAVEGPAAVHHLAFSRANGDVDVLLWQEVPSFDLKTRADLSPAPAKVTLRVAKAAPAKLFRPLAGREAVQSWDAASNFSLDVPDEVIIVRLAGVAIGAGSAPAAPQDLAATTTATGATLKWRSGSGEPVAAFVVNRLGAYLATVLPAADGSATLLDDALVPGFGFPYSIRAVSAAGRLSEPAVVVARTLNQRPDLVVKEIAWEPSAPKPSDEVIFKITLANQGDAATPSEVHGVAIRVDGEVVCWSDNMRESVAPKGARTVRTSNGPKGKGTWTCSAGTFQVEAVADDVNRIEESREQNNSRRVVLSTGVGADLIVTSLTASEPATVGKPVTLTAKVKNQGSAATPAKAIISCTFQREEGDKRSTLGFNAWRQSLPPGASADISLIWTPTQAGAYRITGLLDDIDRIAELDEKNNRCQPLLVEVKPAPVASVPAIR